ncbi:unnamed protein product [Anisakis simplex]|uniref:G_PROTEIN_RECEP_F1_2 domain-containing protein n=1 Tax=Anisakis simplex TaxID=6269 RepID=A0A0M3K190_ANISI|nr:unnamed protein product [Anisakis simplex]
MIAVDKDKDKDVLIRIMVLALLDLLLCLTYLWMFAFPKFAVTFRLAFLYWIVWETNIYVYTLGRMTQMAIPYVIIASTAERLAWITGKASMSSQGYGRLVVVILLLTSIFVLRVPALWAMQLTTNAECDLFESKFLSPTEFMSDERFKLFDIVVNFLHIIASFLILTVLNAIIVIKLREYHKAARRQSALISPSVLFESHDMCTAREEERRERQRLRIAIKTTVVIISTYLACNSLHFCLFIIEQFDPTWLLDETGNAFNWIYVMLGDFVSILFVVSSTIRLFIYYKYNAEIREQILSIHVFHTTKLIKTNNKHIVQSSIRLEET